jgi:hypothetical protein
LSTLAVQSGHRKPEKTMPPVDPSISEYMRKIGSAGGRKGGAAKGPQKARSPDHYRKMVDARNAQRAQVRAERERQESESS